MLEPAIKYKDQLEAIQYDTWFNDKYKYWNCSIYHDSIQIHSDTWNYHQFVSTYKGQVIGYISYETGRQTNNVVSLSIMNFSDNSAVFGSDLRRALRDIFEKYKFNKLNFTVVVGNPVEPSYDKMISRFGGRIVGILKQDVKLADGEYYDKKIYEVLSSDYFNAVNKRKSK